jgi:hypothetical protein
MNSSYCHSEKRSDEESAVCLSLQNSRVLAALEMTNFGLPEKHLKPRSPAAIDEISCIKSPEEGCEL